MKERGLAPRDLADLQDREGRNGRAVVWPGRRALLALAWTYLKQLTFRIRARTFS